MTDERRRFIRIPFDAHTLITQADATWEVQLLDISLKGLLIERPDGWAGQPAQPFEARVSLSNQTTVNMTVKLMHEEASRLGFLCEHIDLDSASHLRRLVELNLGDPKELERELGALLSA